MYDFDDGEDEEFPAGFGIPRWWPGYPLGKKKIFKCKSGCGIPVEHALERCLDCDVKANLPAMEIALEEIRGER
jgi:hypothetical protein